MIYLSECVYSCLKGDADMLGQQIHRYSQYSLNVGYPYKTLTYNTKFASMIYAVGYTLPQVNYLPFINNIDMLQW